MSGAAKLTPEQRQELLTLYLDKGFHATKSLAKSYGVSPRYLARLARNNGHTHNYQRKDRAVARRPTDRDPRWQWAIERGAVLI